MSKSLLLLRIWRLVHSVYLNFRYCKICGNKFPEQLLHFIVIKLNQFCRTGSICLSQPPLENTSVQSQSIKCQSAENISREHVNFNWECDINKLKESNFDVMAIMFLVLIITGSAFVSGMYSTVFILKTILMKLSLNIWWSLF